MKFFTNTLSKSLLFGYNRYKLRLVCEKVHIYMFQIAYKIFLFEGRIINEQKARLMGQGNGRDV